MNIKAYEMMLAKANPYNKLAIGEIEIEDEDKLLKVTYVFKELRKQFKKFYNLLYLNSETIINIPINTKSNSI